MRASVDIILRLSAVAAHSQSSKFCALFWGLCEVWSYMKSRYVMRASVDAILKAQGAVVSPDAVRAQILRYVKVWSYS